MKQVSDSQSVALFTGADRSTKVSKLTALASSVSLALGLGLIVPSVAFAESVEDFPSKPIRFVTPYPPGGSHSLHAGIITTVSEGVFGQPMISITRAGGGGVVGAAEVANAKADGYTLLFGDPTINSLRPQVEDLPFEVEDFIPVARINYSPAVFVVRADAPFGTMKEMVEFAKKNPDELVYSSDNLNGWTYTVFELLKVKTDTKMRGVEFGGGGPAVTQLLGGNTMAYAGDPSVVGDHVASGALKALCVTDTEAWPAMPDVKTCQELGYDVVFQFWRGVMVPKDTPAPIVSKLSEGFAKLVEDPGFVSLISKINSKIDFADHEQFSKLFAAEVDNMKAIADSTGK
ncbi:tripartite tricarboxylate transporter substrate binding protein [Allohahella marinimesophila]|uniref:Tripartite tricarboxylate transporter substrate binding protein n=1 Tax=Allohahella marinimesophila TaxID=1054972 RepID=A0ABP7NJ08_9GAMM